MKRILKVIFLSFISVIGAGALLIGGMYLFGGFNEEIVYADNIVFNSTEVVSSEPFAVKITTTTENVNRTTLKLSVLPGGENVIEFPSRVEIGEIFYIIPKQVEGVNFGGNATLKAEYDGDDSNKNAVAFCEILIDVPVKTVSLDIAGISDDRITIPGQSILVCEKDEPVLDVFGINPAHALMPYVKSGEVKVSNIVDKVLYLELVDKLGHALQSTAAQFYVKQGEEEVPQNSNRIEVGYKFRESDNKIVFTENIILKTKDIPTDIVVNAYVYSTYKEQKNNTDIEGVVSFNKELVKTNNFAFTVGESVVTDMLLNTENKEVYLFEDSKIFLNNPNATSRDINLGLRLTTDSQNIPVDDNYLLRTFIKVDNESYRQLTNALGNKTAVDNWVSINYSGISTEKQNWYWILNVNNYLAYKNNTAFNVSIKYAYKETEIIKSFKVISKIREINSVTVSYDNQDDTSFKVESHETDKNLNLTNKFSINSNLTAEQLGYYSLEHFLSYNENFANGKSTIKTVPKEKNSYKAIFSLMLTEDGRIPKLSSNASWCTINKYTFAQEGVDSFIWEGNVTNGNSSNFVANKTINVEAIITFNSTPLTETLFYIEFVRAENLDEKLPTISIDDFGVKFYAKNGETATGSTYSSIPYLAVNDNITYKTDFDFYFDELSSTKFLRIKDLSANLYGIGQFYITAQAIFNDTTNNASYWVGKSARAVIDVSQNLSSITIYSYIDDVVFSKGFETTSFEENDGQTRYLFITSSQIEALRNYINANLIELSATQIFTEAFTEEIYSKIYDINKDKTITFGSTWIEVNNESGKLVGFRKAYYINEVRSILVEENDLPNKFDIVVKAKINNDGDYLFANYVIGDDVTPKANLEFEVKDSVVKTAILSYNGLSNYNTEANPYTIYADLFVNNTEQTNTVIYKEAVANGTPTEVKFAEKLKYAFVYDVTNVETTETLFADFTVEDGSNISLDGLFNFSNQDGLTFYNFPRVENGVLVKMTIDSSTLLPFNSHFVWNNESKRFIETKYDLTAVMYFKVYGLDVKIQVNEEVDKFAVKDSSILLFDENAEKGIFNVSVTSLNPNNDRNTTTYTKIYNYNDFLVTHVTNTMVSLSEDGKSIIAGQDFVENGNVIIRFYVGSNANGNLVRIWTDETTAVPSYTKVIKSPYVVEAIKQFNAPSLNNEFLTLSCIGVDDYLTKFRASMQIVSTTLDPSYNIKNAIKIEEGNLLSFTAVPVDYTAVIKVILTTKEDTPRVREELITISVKAIFADDNILVGNYESGHYTLNAGENHTLSVGNGIEFVDGKPLKDFINNISSITVSFEDVMMGEGDDEFITYVDDRVNVETHMHSAKFDTISKSFRIWSDDINYPKFVRVTLKVVIDEDGFYYFRNVILVKPNINITLNKTTYSEGDRINLTSSDTYKFTKDGTVTELDILSGFEYDNPNRPYSIYSFEFEGRNPTDLAIFTDISEETLDYAGVDVAILNGASSLCGGKTTIKFYYVVNEDSIDAYLLEFTFPININFKYSNNDVVVGEMDNQDNSKFNITAGEVEKVSLGDGILFKANSELDKNKQNIKDVQISFENTDNLDSISAINLMCYKVENKKLENETENKWEISIWARNINISKNVTINFVFTMENGQEVSISKVVTVLPNVSFGLIQENLLEGETIDLGNGLNYKVFVNNEENLTFASNLIENGTITADSAVFDINEKTFTVKTGASEVCEGKTTITFTYDVKTSSTLLYTLVFDFVVEIKANA